jgi:hypothetical protein
VDDIFVDAEEVPESVYFAALDVATTPEEIAFRDVLVFHRDFLNGGLSQALGNQFSSLATYVSAYRVMGLDLLADMIVLASTFAQDGKSRDDFENMDIETLDSAYCAATYGLAYASDLRGDIKLTAQDDALKQRGDSVEQLVLRFARANRDKFRAVVAAASH